MLQPNYQIVPIVKNFGVGFWRWWVCDWCGHELGGAAAARVGDYGGVGLGAWLPPMKHKLGAWPSLSLSLSLSHIWWFVGVQLWILEFGLLVIGGFLILVCWCGGGDFLWILDFDFAMEFGFWYWLDFVMDFVQRRWVVWLRSWTVVVVAEGIREIKIRERREKYFYIILTCSMVK